ncbi:MAG: hypothetical protein AB1476_04285 [Candidatus Hadarchaeota archaeon]
MKNRPTGVRSKKVKRERIVAGSGRHRAVEAVVEGTPAKAWVLKPLRALE